MTSLTQRIILAAALACGSAHAAPMNPDPTGMWYDPAQPGWGMSVTQQGESIFVALFVYDANHKPQWFVASNVGDLGGNGNFLGGEVYGGTLYSTTGPTFTMPADATTLSATPVGTIQLVYTQPSNNLAIAYTVNGTTVNKTLQPQTWGSNAAPLPGYFSGALYVTGGDVFDGMTGALECTPPTQLGNVPNFTVSQGGTPDAFTITWSTGVDTACRMDGIYTQVGQSGTLAGPMTCGPVPNVTTPAGSLSITQMTITSRGFIGFLQYNSPSVNGVSCGYAGAAGGVKVPLPQ